MAEKLWFLEKTGKVPKISKAVLIEGLPGIGNVGKISVDFLVEKLKAKKIYSMFSYTMPHSVFVNEDNLVELPAIDIYYYRQKNQDFLFLVGDVQPTEEASSYSFCETILDLLSEVGCKEIITTGGIGLHVVPENPQVYTSGNSKGLIEQYQKKVKVNDKLYGIVGPIVGVSGLLLGLSQKRKMPALTLLAETYGHPLYIGIHGAREIVKILNKYYDFNLDMKAMDKEIADIEKEIKKAGDMSQVKKDVLRSKADKIDDVNYIG